MAHTRAEPGASLRRSAQPDEYAILLPDRASEVVVQAGDPTQTIEGHRSVFVPPGQGAIDPHVHSGPSEPSAAGFAAIITKHHPELSAKVYFSVVLNNVVGGCNAYAVGHTAALGGKIVFMPTLAAENHLRWGKTAGWVHPASTQKMPPATGIPVLDVIARTDIVLASGHLHVSETWRVFEEAQRRGVTRMMLTHPEDIVRPGAGDAIHRDLVCRFNFPVWLHHVV